MFHYCQLLSLCDAAPKDPPPSAADNTAGNFRIAGSGRFIKTDRYRTGVSNSVFKKRLDRRSSTFYQ
jgi:hypothetical protein